MFFRSTLDCSFVALPEGRKGVRSRRRAEVPRGVASLELAPPLLSIRSTHFSAMSRDVVHLPPIAEIRLLDAAVRRVVDEFRAPLAL